MGSKVPQEEPTSSVANRLEKQEDPVDRVADQVESASLNTDLATTAPIYVALPSLREAMQRG
jgi:hypothetical protein